MTPTYNKIHNRFKLNGEHYTKNELKEAAYSFIKEGLPYEQAVGDFLLDWLDDNDFIKVKTSGSTGAPKTIKLKKQHMVNSAIATGDFFNITIGHKALLCLPVSYIAGKMMLVRALILGLELDLVEPTSNPLQNIPRNIKYDFCAMIPLQLENSINLLSKIKKVIIGGAPVSQQLKEKIANCSTNVFETYGMTETTSHIAVKPINGKDKSDYFTVLPNVNISQDERGCLVISAPKVSNKTLVTNDVVKLHGNLQFEWLGRFDYVINSGGIKIHPEQVEKKLASVINQRFFITSLPDNVLGERVVLVVEGNHSIVTDIKNLIQQQTNLTKYETPKEFLVIEKFTETHTGKINRQITLQNALKQNV